MKKLLGLCLLMGLVLTTQVFGTCGLMELCLPCEMATYVLITTKNVTTELPVTQTSNGNNVIIKTDYNHAKALFASVNYVVGEAWEFETNEPNSLLEQLENQLQFEVLSQCFVGNILVIDAYTNRLPYEVTYHNQKQNLQLAITDNKVVVGTPFILHSY